jgi:mannose-6-phosphate isomerase-like protein (cupin superfamily)
VRRNVLHAAAAAALLGAGTFLGVALARAGTQPSAPRYSIENSAVTFKMDGVEKTKAGYQYWFFDKVFAEGRSIKLSVVGPHQKSHEPHKHDGHEFFFVLEGKAAFFLEGETKVVGPQTALYCPPWSMHGISNAGNTELKYLVIKDYPWPPEPAAATSTPQPAPTAAAKP